MEIYILIIGLILFIFILMIAIIKSFIQLFKESKSLNIDRKITIRCPKCGDTYTILENELAGGDGLTPVKCYTCGYEYKQNFAIVEES